MFAPDHFDVFDAELDPIDDELTESEPCHCGRPDSFGRHRTDGPCYYLPY